MAEPIKPTNIGLFQAYFPNKKKPYTVVPIPGEDGAYVDARFPNKVFVDPAYTTIPNLFEHEFEHQLNRKAGKRYGENFDEIMTRPEYKYWEANLYEAGLNPVDTAYNLRYRVQNSVEDISNALKKKTGQPLDPRSRLWDATLQPLSEVLAELSSLESVLRTDFTRDKEFREKIFGTANTDTVAQVYKSVTGGRQDRLDARDIEPYTVQQQGPQEPSIVNYFTDLLFNKRKF